MKNQTASTQCDMNPLIPMHPLKNFSSVSVVSLHFRVGMSEKNYALNILPLQRNEKLKILNACYHSRPEAMTYHFACNEWYGGYPSAVLSAYAHVWFSSFSGIVLRVQASKPHFHRIAHRQGSYWLFSMWLCQLAESSIELRARRLGWRPSLRCLSCWVSQGRVNLIEIKGLWSTNSTRYRGAYKPSSYSSVPKMINSSLFSKNKISILLARYGPVNCIFRTFTVRIVGVSMHHNAKL